MTLEINTSSVVTMDEETLYNEVEDIMCDQGIISLEFTTSALDSETSYTISATRLRVAVAVFARALMPAVLKIYYVYLRNQQLVVDNVRRHLFHTVVAFLANSISGSLASVQKHITYPLTRRSINNINEVDLVPTIEEVSDTVPEKSVDCQVLFVPKEELLADVIFIHGLHGGIDKTWKQGRWRHDGHKLKYQSPVRSNSTGNLYIPPRTHSLKRTLSDIDSARTSHKIARKENEICVTRDEGDWEVIDDVDVDEDDCYSNCWPQDWLPKDCPGVRVIALNYTTDVLWCPVWKKKRRRTDMVERSDEMINELRQLGVGKKPVIWVGHSKGGLFIKQIILNAWEKHSDCSDIFGIFENTKAIMFYSVPHKGSALADFTLPLLRRSVELIEIQRNCNFVLDLHERFLDICKQGHLKADIFSFIETSFTLMSFIYLKIVAYESANPDIGVKCDVPLDHREICKPAGRDCFLYLELVNLIKKHMKTNT